MTAVSAEAAEQYLAQQQQTQGLHIVDLLVPKNNVGISQFHSAITTQPNAAMPTTTNSPIFQQLDLQQFMPISVLL
jgi:hypothetical protein